MTDYQSFKFRIYPNKAQEIFLAREFGATRFLYNFFLERRQDNFKNKKKSSYNDDCAYLTKIKKQERFDWLRQSNSQSLQASLKNLDTSYKNFFKKQNRFPRFHSKSGNQCVKVPQFFKIVNNYLFLPKMKKPIKMKVHRKFSGEPSCVFISKNPSGQFFASFRCKRNEEAPAKVESKIGIDLGLTNIVTTSDGETVARQRTSPKQEKTFKYNQRRLSKKAKGSSNRWKQRLKVAKNYRKISDKRRDFLHKLSNKIVNENQVIITESLAVKKMMKNHFLAKHIHQTGWGELLRQLEYKAAWRGRTFHKVDRFFPSSKMCSNCKFVRDKLPLSIRGWECSACGAFHNRDINAAKNILHQGLSDLDFGVAGRSPDGVIFPSSKTCGGAELDLANAKSNRSTKQEALALRRG
jgi:putative transposase